MRIRAAVVSLALCLALGCAHGGGVPRPIPSGDCGDPPARGDLEPGETIHLIGDVFNRQSQFASQVALDVHILAEGRARAVGIFDGVTLFGRFDVDGAQVDRRSGGLSFAGQLEFGFDTAGFPRETYTEFGLELSFHGEGITGEYSIAPLLPFYLIEQPGLLVLRECDRSRVAVIHELAAGEEIGEAERHWHRAIAHEQLAEYKHARRSYLSYTELRPDEARGHGKLAIVDIQDGRPRAALRWAERAVELEPEEFLWSLYLGHAHLLAGDPEAAHVAYEQASRLLKWESQLDDVVDRDLAMFVERGWAATDADAERRWFRDRRDRLAAIPYGRGRLHRALGDDETAIGELGEAIAIWETEVGDSHPILGEPLGVLAGALIAQGDLVGALHAAERAHAIAEASWGPEDRKNLDCLWTMAWMYESLGELDRAEAALLTALALAMQHDTGADEEADLAPMARTRLGLFLGNRRGRCEEADQLYREGLAGIRETTGPESPFMSYYYNGMGLILACLGQLDEAREEYEHSLRLGRHGHGEGHPSIAVTLFNLAMLDWRAGYPLEALARNAEVLERALVMDDPAFSATVLSSTSQLLDDVGRREDAIFFGKQAVNTLQDTRSHNLQLDAAFRSSFVRSRAWIYRDLAAMLVEEGRLPEAQQVLAMLKEDEFDEFVRGEGEGGDADAKQIGLNGRETARKRHHDELSSQVVRLSERSRWLRSRVEPTPDQVQELREIQRDLETARAGFYAALDQIHELPDDHGVIASKNLYDVEAMQDTLEALGEGTVLLHTVVTDEALHVILTTPEIQVARSHPIPEPALNRLVFRFRDGVMSPHADPLGPARELYDALIGPVADDLAQAGARTLMVSLDGALRYAPLAALHDGEDYLVESYRIALFTEAGRSGSPVRSDVVWSVAALGVSHELDGFPALPNVETELATIVIENEADPDGVWPGKVRLNEAFSLQALTDVLEERAPVVHIASHFHFAAGTVSNSYLLLGDGDRLTLSALKEKGIRFRGVQLLTLSACQTGVEEQRNGGGKEVEGLAVLAQRRGARGVLATLWPVADASTGQFMESFYRELAADPDADRAAALQRTQRRFLRGETGMTGAADDERGAVVSGSPGKGSGGTPVDYTHPYYWAPFILMGQWR